MITSCINDCLAEGFLVTSKRRNNSWVEGSNLRKPFQFNKVTWYYPDPELTYTARVNEIAKVFMESNVYA